MSPLLALAGMRESLRLLNSFDAADRERRALAAAHAIIEGLRARGLDVRRQESTLISAGGIDASALASQGVVVATVDGRLRLSTHFFTTRADVDALLDRLP